MVLEVAVGLYCVCGRITILAIGSRRSVKITVFIDLFLAHYNTFVIVGSCIFVLFS